MAEQNVEILVNIVADRLGESPSLSGVIEPDTNELCSLFRNFGQIGVVPLWQGLYQFCGLRVMPGRPLAQWPGILLSAKGFGQTIASNHASLLGMWVLHTAAPYGEITAAIGTQRAAVTREARTLQKTLGGDGSDLDKLGEAFAIGFQAERGTEAIEQDFSAAARMLDRSEEFAVYADWLDAAQDGHLTLPEAEQMGLWARLATVRSWSEELERAVTSPSLVRELVRVVAETAAIDASVRQPLSWISMPGSRSPRATIAQLSRALSGLEDVFDEPESTLVERIARVGVDYEGLAHAEAAAVLAEAGEPERAWDFLCAAAWWMVQATGEVPPAIFDGIVKLCDDRGWSDERWVVERIRGSHQ